MAAAIHAAADAYAKELRQPPPPGAPHGVALPGTESPGRSAIYRHWRFTDKPLLATLNPEVKTVHDLFDFTAQRWPNRPLLGYRPWVPETQTHQDRFEWINYGEVAKRRKNFGAGLMEIHEALFPGKAKFGVGLWSQNRPEWQLVDLGCISQGLFTVSLYETLGPDAVEFIINHAELTVIVSSLPHIPILLKLAPRLPHVKLIISIDNLDGGEEKPFTKRSILNELAAPHGIQIYSMDEIEQLGEQSNRPMKPALSEDVYTINYTSGTTGTPKGVILTHGTILAGNAGARVANDVHKDVVGLSYLPLAHMLQRLVEHAGFAAGARCGYFRGDLIGLPEDIKLLKPTVFASVPRLYNRFNSAIRAATIESEGFRGSFSRRAIDTKLANLKLPIGQATHKHWLYDRIWAPKVKAAIGFDRMTGMVSGSAPLDPDVQEFLTVALGARLHQGYGLTESSGVATVQLEGDYSTGNVGPPSPCVEICLESIPDMDYSVEDKPFPRGEILLRGPGIFKGYFKNEEENKKALEPDGWFHTGDVALIDELGRLKIVDRKKNIVKLSQGEYVAPERIENVLTANCSQIAIAYVHGDGSQSSLVGIFGVNPDTFAPFASKVLGQTIEPANLEAIKQACTDSKVKKEFMKTFDVIAKTHRFNGYERVRNVLLALEPFTVDNETLTPTLKLKRPQAARAFRQEIDRMYAEIAAQPQTSRVKL